MHMNAIDWRGLFDAFGAHPGTQMALHVDLTKT